MALKYDDDLSEFGTRLITLMDGKSPRTVATDLIDAKLVRVEARKKFDKADEKRKSAIGSVEKRIREHIKAPDPSCLQGEYVMAYCAYFHCSADYLFCYTDIMTPDIDARAMCQKTHFSEKAILNLLGEGLPRELVEFRNTCWSSMIESDLYHGIPQNWLDAQKQALMVVQTDQQLHEAREELLHTTGPDRLDLECDIEGYETRLSGSRAAMAGVLFNVSRNLAAFIEGRVIQTAGRFRQGYENRAASAGKNTVEK